MRGYFIFDFESEKSKNIVVLYCAGERLDKKSLSSCIKKYCDHRIPPDKIIIIAPRDKRNKVSDIVDSERFNQRLKSYTRYRNPSPVECWFYGANGRVIGDVDDNRVKEVKRHGLFSIFHTRNGMQESTPEYHYIKPSGSHSNNFIRTANVLVDGAEIQFIAFCCLEYLHESFRNNELQHIYCDTGAIHSIGQSINDLRRRLLNNSHDATIDSFGSYEGLNEHEFRHPRKSLVLISASTSGGLEAEVKSIHPEITSERIVTIFYHGHSPSGQVVCNLIDKEEGPEGYAPTENYEPEKCLLCDSGSTAVPVTGDQFLVESVVPNAVILRTKHAPDWLSPFVKNYQGTSAIRANYSRNESKSNRSIFFDVRQLLSNQRIGDECRFEQRLGNLLNRSLPATLSRIVYMTDDSSRWMAESIREFANDRGIDEIEMSSLAEVERDIDDHVREEGSTVVVASAVATGRSLLTASQVLREAQTNNAISYFVGIARMSGQSKLRSLRGNVTYEDRPGDYPFCLVDSVFLPLDSSEDGAPWREEIALINELIGDISDESLISNLRDRKSFLASSASKTQRGLTNELFLRDVNGNNLNLRPGFAFYNFDYQQGDINQAEVMFTIMSVLHYVRQDRGVDFGSRADVADRLVLDPICFERFNDGVIQAALLRATRRTELDYSIAPEKSKQMALILEAILRNAESESGEAALEFLLALATGKLQLTDEDFRRLETEQPLGDIDHDLASALWRQAVQV